MEFKDRLRQLRTEAKMSQEELGKELNYKATTISNYEAGRNEPGMKILIEMTKIFGVTLDYLCGISEIKNPYLELEGNRKENLKIVVELFYKLDNKKDEELLNYMNYLASEVSNDHLQLTTLKTSKSLKVAESRPKLEY